MADIELMTGIEGFKEMLDELEDSITAATGEADRVEMTALEEEHLTDEQMQNLLDAQELLERAQKKVNDIRLEKG